jgi:anti-anti-sigma factor
MAHRNVSNLAARARDAARCSTPGHAASRSQPVARARREGCGERRVSLVGEMDRASVDVLRAGFAPLVGDEAGAIVVDCTDLAFIDAAALRVLVSVAGECERRNRPFALVNLPPYFERLVSRLGLAVQLHVVARGQSGR